MLSYFHFPSSVPLLLGVTHVHFDYARDINNPFRNRNKIDLVEGDYEYPPLRRNSLPTLIIERFVRKIEMTRESIGIVTLLDFGLMFSLR